MEPTNESVNVRGEESAEADQRIQFAGAWAQLVLGIGKDPGDFVTEDLVYYRKSSKTQLNPSTSTSPKG